MGCDIHPYAEVRRNGRWERATELPRDRDYKTFALLADVRNYSTDPPIKPISPPRGLPIDVAWSDEAESDGTGTWLGDHSFSWLTLAELEKVDAWATITLQGFVSKEAARNYQLYGWTPQEWCQGTNDPEMVPLKWEQPLSRCCYLLPRLIAALRKLGAPEDVRMVFGFDN